MALTAQVKDELSRLKVTKSCCRKAEVSSMLRFAGGLHIISGRIVIEAELDTAASARRLRTHIADMFGHTSEILVISPGGLRRSTKYVVRVVKDGESLARQTGLLDSLAGCGHPELHRAIVAPRVLRRHVAGRVEVLDLSGDAAFHPRGVEMRDRPDAGTALEHGPPGGFDAETQRGDCPHPRDHDALAHHSSPSRRSGRIPDRRVYQQAQVDRFVSRL